MVGNDEATCHRIVTLPLWIRLEPLYRGLKEDMAVCAAPGPFQHGLQLSESLFEVASGRERLILRLTTGPSSKGAALSQL